jgi:hypothetical protein
MPRRNARLARKLANAIGERRLRLGTPVREIRTDAANTIVRDAAGQTYEADHVVLAVPPTTWHNIRFSPGLPRTLKPQMGVAVKYLAGVKRRFWAKSGLSPDAFTDGMVSMTWDATDNQGSDANGAAMVGFSGGPAAERARQAYARQKDAAYAAALTEIYPTYPQNFVQARFMDWPGEMWTGAGYSFPAPRQVTTVGAGFALGNWAAPFRRRAHLLQICRLYGGRVELGCLGREANRGARCGRCRSEGRGGRGLILGSGQLHARASVGGAQGVGCRIGDWMRARVCLRRMRRPARHGRALPGSALRAPVDEKARGSCSFARM